jgi:hypothetical protein
MRGVMECEPKLAWNGIGAGRFERREDGRWESATENYARFLKRRAELLDNHVIDEFMRAIAFLAAVTPTKTIRPDTNSYRLKHIAENFPCRLSDGDELGPMYVSNGALIAGAIHLGFRHRKYIDHLGYDDPNVNFNMNKRQLDDLDCLYRPDGGRAQDRARRAEMRRYGWPFGRGMGRAA